MPQASIYEVTIITDYTSTAGIVRQIALTLSATDKLNNRLIRVSLYLSQYKNLKIYYVLGRKHIVLDALLRLLAYRGYEYRQSEDVLDDLVMLFILEIVVDIFVVSTILDILADFKKALQRGYETDQFIADAGEIACTEPDTKAFYQQDELLQYKLRLYILEGLEGDVFVAVYDGQFYIRSNRLYARVREQYYIRYLDCKVRTYIQHYEDCQRA